MPVTQRDLEVVLQRARDMIAHGWIKSNWARDHEKKSVDPWDESACEWCIEGAILGATHFEQSAEELAEASAMMLQMANPEFTDLASLHKIANNKGNTTKIGSYSLIPSVNDKQATTHKQIVRMFNNAIELVRRSKWNDS